MSLFPTPTMNRQYTLQADIRVWFNLTSRDAASSILRPSPSSSTISQFRCQCIGLWGAPAGRAFVLHQFRMPPTRVATMGSSAAMASSSTLGEPSLWRGDEHVGRGQRPGRLMCPAKIIYCDVVVPAQALQARALGAVAGPYSVASRPGRVCITFAQAP